MKDDARTQICTFLKKHHVLTLCTAIENESWCASCFYFFDESRMTFFLMTEADTRHAKMMRENPRISGAVAGQPKIVSRIQGLQFSGSCRMLEDFEAEEARKHYLHRFPIATMASAPLWAASIETAKFTDNRLGFGTKLLWKRDKDSTTFITNSATTPRLPPAVP